MKRAIVMLEYSDDTPEEQMSLLLQEIVGSMYQPYAAHPEPGTVQKSAIFIDSPRQRYAVIETF